MSLEVPTRRKDLRPFLEEIVARIETPITGQGVTRTSYGTTINIKGGSGESPPRTPDGYFPFINKDTETQRQGGNWVPAYGCVMAIDADGSSVDAATWKAHINAPSTEWNACCWINGADVVGPNQEGKAYDGASGPVIALVKFPSWMDADDENGDPLFPDSMKVGMELGPCVYDPSDSLSQWYLFPSYPSVCTLVKRLERAPNPFQDCWYCECRYHDLRCGPMVQGQCLEWVGRGTKSFIINDVKVVGQDLGYNPVLMTQDETLSIFNQGHDTDPASGKAINLGAVVLAVHNLHPDSDTAGPYGGYQHLDSGCALYFD